MTFPSDEQFAADVRRELLENILPFWRERSVDGLRGGFIAQMSNDLRLQENASKGLILNARILWTFSAAYRYTQNCEDRFLAERAYDYLTSRFYDPKYGGYYWELDLQGDVLNDQKKIYGQAFVLYAMAEYYRTFAASKALEQAVEVFHHIETHARDSRHGGYYEVLSRDWRLAENMRLSDKDMDAKKSMNNHLHVLEAYANLRRISLDPLVAERLQELIELFRRHILDAEQTHFHHFFDESWAVKSDSYTFGHDIEGSWLLCEAAEALGDHSLVADVRIMAAKIAHAALQGLDAAGGLCYEGRGDRIIDKSKEWWPQAEAVVGFWNAWQITGETAFREASLNVWRFIQDRIVDRVHGEWFWRVSEDGTPDDSLSKISIWKCPYHNSRCCLEILHRIQSP
jgi:mannobiose 2-epimerase